MIQHRPPEEMLVDFATGALPQPVSLAVSVHAHLCDRSRRDIAEMERIGGAMLRNLQPVAMDDGALVSVMERIKAPAIGMSEPASADARTSAGLPKSVIALLRGQEDGIVWKKKGAGVESAALPSDTPDFDVRLLRIRGGRAVPEHTHTGREITLCLTGGYVDEDRHYARGDFQVADASVTHRPVADADEDCIVLAVIEKRIRLTSPIGRLINPFVRL